MEEEEVDEALPLTVAGVERSEVYEAEAGDQCVENASQIGAVKVQK